MPIPRILLPVKSQDYNVSAIKAHKRYIVTDTDYSASGYVVRNGTYSTIKTPISSSKAANDPRNPDGTYEHVVWRSINHRYYQRSHDPLGAHEHTNQRLHYKELYVSCSIMSFPYLDMGEKIKPGTLEVTNSGIYLNDDNYGNVYVRSGNTASFANGFKLVGYWGFNDQYRNLRWGYGFKGLSTINYQSNVYEVDRPSRGYNVKFKRGVEVGNPLTSSGHCAAFESDGFISTPHNPELNFGHNQDFSISFWCRIPVSQSGNSVSQTTAVITKRWDAYRENYGINVAANESGRVVRKLITTSSVVSDPTTIYPYDFMFYNHRAPAQNEGRILFRRSDGQKTVELKTTGSIVSNKFQHVCVTKSGSLVSLYLNGIKHTSGSDVYDHPVNDHILYFGAENKSKRNALSGSLDEIRIYKYALSTNEISELSNRTTGGGVYQSYRVGNIFYRGGFLVISPLLPQYQNVLTGSFTVKYRNTHTIYQHEAYCKVKKGQANLTMNPSALKYPNGDILKDDFTSSLSPYATTIGLYNADGVLVAVGKLGQPIQMRDDVDINFVVRWDV